MWPDTTRTIGNRGTAEAEAGSKQRRSDRHLRLRLESGDVRQRRRRLRVFVGPLHFACVSVCCMSGFFFCLCPVCVCVAVRVCFSPGLVVCIHAGCVCVSPDRTRRGPCLLAARPRCGVSPRAELRRSSTASSRSRAVLFAISRGVQVDFRCTSGALRFVNGGFRCLR